MKRQKALLRDMDKATRATKLMATFAPAPIRKIASGKVDLAKSSYKY